MNSSLAELYKPIIEAVRAAAGVCRGVQDRVMSTDSDASGPMQKEDDSPVTIADYSAQAIVCAALRETFPDDPVIAEEDATRLASTEQHAARMQIVELVRQVHPSANEEDVLGWINRGTARDYSPRYWTVDPIDGTEGFIRGKQYCVCVALVVDGQVEWAALGCPNLPFEDNSHAPDDSGGSLFYAHRSQGAWSEPLDGSQAAKKLSVSEQDDIRQARYCESFNRSHSDQHRFGEIARELGIVAEPLRFDSQVKYAVVARGDVDFHVRLPPTSERRESVWDHASGTLLIEEAGGRVTDVRGKPLDYRRVPKLQDNWGILATNGKVHEVLSGKVE